MSVAIKIVAFVERAALDAGCSSPGGVRGLSIRGGEDTEREILGPYYNTDGGCSSDG